MRKKGKYLLSAVFIFMTAISCDDYFAEPLDFNSVSEIYNDSISVREYITSIYNYVPRGYNRLGGSMLDASTDLAVHSSSGSQAYFMGIGAWGPSSNPDNNWDRKYEGVRSANIYINSIHPNISENVILDTVYKNQLLGQVIFLRALFYAELVKRFGGVPLIQEVLGSDEDWNISRNTYDESIDFIVQECNRAAELLPEQYQNNSAEDFGRATRGAALALKARMLLYSASPLFNDPGQTEDSPWHGAYDAQKWEYAAQAAHEVIALNRYQLNDQYFRFFIQFNFTNREMIFNRVSGPHNHLERDNGPTGITGGRGGTAPSLNLVDSYRRNNGETFDWENPDHSEFPFLFRENRFVASILFNGRPWMGHGIETFEGGVDMQSVNSTKTSFYLRKFMDEEARWFGGQTGVAYHNWPILRYAEVLLNFAEAMNEAYGPYADPQNFGMTAASALEEIRERGMLNPYEVPLGFSKEQMRVLIHLERKIELAFEEHRPFDLRRWKKAEEILNQPVMGLRIIQNEDNSYTYERIEVEERLFTPEMYLYPIPKNEIEKIPVLVQNPGW